MIRKRGKINKKTIYILSIIIVLFIVYFLFKLVVGKELNFGKKNTVCNRVVNEI